MEVEPNNNKRKVKTVGDEEEDFFESRNEDLFKEFESETLQQKKQKKSMPKKGVKAMFPSEEAEQVAAQKRESWYKQTVQNSVRAQRVKNLSVGIWREELKLIELQTLRGKAHNKMGISIKGIPYLRVEEAMYTSFSRNLMERFLVDSGQLEILDHGIPLSIQECYRLIDLDPFLSMEKYLVFSYLNRLGYIVLRYSNSISRKKVKISENKNSFDSKQSELQSKQSPNTATRGWWPLSEYCSIGKLSKEEENGNKMEEDKDILIQRKKEDERIQSYSQLPKLESPNWENWLKGTKSESPEITYDVYLPQGFKKTKNEPPAWRIIVYKFLDKFPGIRDIHKLLAESDPVPVKFCVVQNGTINFLEMKANT